MTVRTQQTYVPKPVVEEVTVDVVNVQGQACAVPGGAGAALLALLRQSNLHQQLVRTLAEGACLPTVVRPAGEMRGVDAEPLELATDVRVRTPAERDP